MNTRRIALFVASATAALALIGTGVAASFTDSATATESISVGTFGISISSTTPTAVVSGKTVTLTCPALQSSAAGSCPLSFTVTGAGTIPAVVTVSDGGVTGDLTTFTDLFVNPGAQTLGNGVAYTYSGGLQWPALTNANLGENVSIVYTINAAG